MPWRIKLLVYAFLNFFFLVAQAQSKNDLDAVMKPIRGLFEGMQKGDSALAHAAFAKEVTSATLSVDKDGKPVFRTESSMEDFIKAIGTPHAELWNEVIWDEKISIDGNFAQVWVNYAFYRGKKFSHCGVDAFHLVRSGDGVWKIFHLADTRRKEGCNIPSRITKQFE